MSSNECDMCGGLGYYNQYRIMTDNGLLDGFIYAKDERAMLKRHPEAICIGSQNCECLRPKRIEKLFGFAGLPKHREHCTFEWFDAQSDGARKGKQDARKYAELMARGLSFRHPYVAGLCLKGETGVGKSSLAACIVRERLKVDVSCLWIDLNEFLDECYKAQQRMFNRNRIGSDDDSPTNPFEFVDTVATVPFLVLDDFGDMARTTEVTDYQRDKVYSVIRRRYEKELPTVITTNLTVEQLYFQFHKRITDRIGESWLWCEMEGDALRFIER